MKEEKIKKLFKKYHSTCYDAMEARHVKVLLPDDLTQAINQAELEWYRFLQMKLAVISRNNSFYMRQELQEYRDEIQNKIKELENGHS